jgi:hypothetical protein
MTPVPARTLHLAPSQFLDQQTSEVSPIAARQSAQSAAAT